MVCVAYCLAAVYALFAIFIVLQEWYPHHCETYYTETCGVRILLWTAFIAIMVWSLHNSLGED